MRTLLAFAIASALQLVATSQAWRDAYATGNYRRAADLLHSAMINSMEIFPPDPEPAMQLAIMYAQGQGVERDPVLACTLASYAGSGALSQPWRDRGEWFTAATRARERYCSVLTPDELAESGELMGCFMFGFRPLSFDTADGRHVSVTRRGILIADAQGEHLEPLAGPFRCAAQFGLTRHSTLEPPEDAADEARTRHLIEFFVWLPVPRTERVEQALGWEVHEIVGHTAPPVLFEELLRAPGSGWRPRGLPPEVDANLSLQMIPSGHVRWRFEGPTPRHGWILRPDTKGDWQ